MSEQHLTTAGSSQPHSRLMVAAMDQRPMRGGRVSSGSSDVIVYHRSIFLGSTRQPRLSQDGRTNPMIAPAAGRLTLRLLAAWVINSA